MISRIIIPDLGATDADVVLEEWLVEKGDFVKSGVPIFVVTTDKATVEVESFRDGYIRDIIVSAGKEMPTGETIGFIADSMEETMDDMSSEEKIIHNTDVKHHRVLASPLARRMAQKHGIDIASVKGSGTGGRIQKRDVLAIVESQIGSKSELHLDKSIRRIPVSPMRKAIAKRTSISKAQAPHFYVSITIDMTEAQAFRKQAIIMAEKNGWIPPSLNDVIIKSATLALKQTPQLNASFQDDEIIYYDEINIGLVVGLSDGMIVPVIKNADRKNLYTLARITRSLKDKANARKLSNNDLSGSTFTISNLGMFGVDNFVAVINPPEAAILALGASRLQPAVWQNQLAIRELMTATLSADHRLVDGEVAAKFLNDFKDLLENPIRLVFEPPEEDTE